ncbi:MAG: DUF4286 family protein [Alistipes sp.]|nr:DUF4286 family protein [Alistipes sp.]
MKIFPDTPPAGYSFKRMSRDFQPRKIYINFTIDMSYTVNISFFVEPSVHGQWLELVKGKFLPFLKENGCPGVRFFRVLHDGTQPAGFTYGMMADCAGMDFYKKFTGELFDQYKSIATPLFGQRVQTFVTLLKESV